MALIQVVIREIQAAYNSGQIDSCLHKANGKNVKM